MLFRSDVIERAPEEIAASEAQRRQAPHADAVEGLLPPQAQSLVTVRVPARQHHGRPAAAGEMLGEIGQKLTRGGFVGAVEAIYENEANGR